MSSKKQYDTAAKVQLGIIPLLVFVYLLQAATPLRLHRDTVELLSIAETAAHGGGFLYHGQPTVFAPGYPALLAVLMKVNLARVWVIVGLNVMFLVIGLLAVRYILDSTFFSGRNSVYSVCILSLLSFVLIKYSAIVLTDTLFFGVSMSCVAALKSASSQFSLRRVIVGVILVIASICTRRIGIALIPALLWVAISRSEVRSYCIGLSGRMKALGVLIIGLVIAWAVHTTSMLLTSFNTVLTGHTIIDSLFGILVFRLRELGEITINLPRTALPPMVQHLLPFIGAIALSLVLGGVAMRRTRFDVVDAFFVSYLAVIFVWPFYDPRFWLPVIPLLFAYVGLLLKGVMQRHQITRPLIAGYVVTFSMAGLITLASNTSISFSGSGFADAYPEGRYHSTNCAVWHCKEFDSAIVDPDGLHLLLNYK